MTDANRRDFPYSSPGEKLMPLEYSIFAVPPGPERFDEVAANHAKWRAVASHLVAAAQLLWPHIDAAFRAKATKPEDLEGLRYRDPFYLLMKLAVENLAKAIIIRRRLILAEKVTNGDVLAFGGSRCVRSALITARPF